MILAAHYRQEEVTGSTASVQANKVNDKGREPGPVLGEGTPFGPSFVLDATSAADSPARLLLPLQCGVVPGPP